MGRHSRSWPLRSLARQKDKKWLYARGRARRWATFFRSKTLGLRQSTRGPATNPVFCGYRSVSLSDTRFEALHGYRLTPIVGRDHQVGLLESLFESARSGQGQVALISG